MTVYFISDLHLNQADTSVTNRFLSLLRYTKHNADALYILGDLFEAWVGDDIDEPWLDEIYAALHQTSQQIPVYFMHGNRDFMIGKRFCQHTGCQLLQDPCVVELYGEKILLSHGDRYCTLDSKYQAYRKKVHNRFLQWLFLRLPMRIRKEIGLKLRSQKQASHPQSNPALFDVTDVAIETAMQQHQCRIMIHGHTHKPNIHEHPCGKRYVMGAWEEHAEILRLKADGEIQLIPIDSLFSEPHMSSENAAETL